MTSRTDTPQACVKLVKAKSSEADAVTWMKKTGKCWADIGHASIRNAGESDRRYMSCTLGDVPDTTEAAMVETEAPIVEPVVPIVEPVAPVTAPAELVKLNE